MTETNPLPVSTEVTPASPTSDKPDWFVDVQPPAKAQAQAAAPDIKLEAKYPTGEHSVSPNGYELSDILTKRKTEEEALRYAGQFNQQVPLCDGTDRYALPNGPIVNNPQPL